MRSLYKRQFILTAGMILVSFALLGVAFFTLSYQYTIRQTKESMERNADYVANFTSKSRALGLGVEDDIYITMIATIARSPTPWYSSRRRMARWWYPPTA